MSLVAECKWVPLRTLLPGWISILWFSASGQSDETSINFFCVFLSSWFHTSVFERNFVAKIVHTSAAVAGFGFFSVVQARLYPFLLLAFADRKKKIPPSKANIDVRKYSGWFCNAWHLAQMKKNQKKCATSKEILYGNEMVSFALMCKSEFDRKHFYLLRIDLKCEQSPGNSETKLTERKRINNLHCGWLTYWISVDTRRHRKGAAYETNEKKKSVIVAIKMASNVKIPLNCKACWPCSRPLHYLIVCCCFASCLFLFLTLSFSLYVWCVWIGCFFGAAITHYHWTRMRQLH